MLHNIIKASAVCERMIGHVYYLLSRLAELGSQDRVVLTSLAEEEKEHANTLLEIMDHLPKELEGYDYFAIIDYQTEFMARLVLIQEDLEGDVDWIDVYQKLEGLEGSLADNLLTHLKLILTDEHKSKADRLSDESATHATRLRALIEARG